MFLNIVTPCSRPKNLISIYNNINIPKKNYRWIVVFDDYKIPFECVWDNTEFYAYKDNVSRFGNSQRNYALSLINNGHVYFNDDDTTIHPLLWDNIKELDKMDFITFNQCFKSHKHRLSGNNISIGRIDSHNFICSYNICYNISWCLKNYGADGIFATSCFNQCDKDKYVYINKYLSIYNSLR